MFAQFIYPFQNVNHPAFSQFKMKGIMTSLPQIQLDSTQHMSTLQHAILHIQHVIEDAVPREARNGVLIKVTRV